MGTSPLLVTLDGNMFGMSSGELGVAMFGISGPNAVGPGGALPTMIDSAASASHQVTVIGPDAVLLGEITGITQTQGPEIVPAPEPATLTLSVLGLATLAARRRRFRRALART